MQTDIQIAQQVILIPSEILVKPPQQYYGVTVGSEPIPHIAKTHILQRNIREDIKSFLFSWSAVFNPENNSIFLKKPLL